MRATPSPALESACRIGACLIHPDRNLIAGPGGNRHVEPRVMDVLCVLAAQQGDVVTREHLIEQVWAVEFGGDESLTRAVSQLRKAFRAVGGAAQYIETIKKRGYRLSVPVGPAQIDESDAVPEATPIPEATPETAPESNRAGRRSKASLRRSVVLFCGVVALAGAAVWALPGLSGFNVEAPREARNRVEVRPFEPVSGAAGMARITQDLTDRVLNVLVANGVKATPARPQAGRQGGPGERPEFVISGSVEQSGERYLANVRFGDFSDGLVLWALQFESAAASQETFQKQAAAKVADVVSCALRMRGPAERGANRKVFSLFLRICDTMRGDSLSGYEPYELARQAALIAPDLAMAQGAYAAYSAIYSRQQASPEEAASFRANAAAAADRALALDPDCGPALFAQAVLLERMGHWAERENYLRRALEHAPEFPFSRHYYSVLLLEVGRTEEAITFARRALALDPLSPYETAHLARLLAANGALQESAALFDKARSLWPNSLFVKIYGFYAAYWNGAPGEARALLDANETGLDLPQAEKVCLYAFLDARQSGEAAGRARVKAACAGGVDGALSLSRMLAALGDVDGAYEAIEHKMDAGPNDSITLFYPEMHVVWRDVRFMSLAVRFGLTDYWLSTDKWPDFCADRDLPYDCRAQAQAAERAPGVASPRRAQN